jgi:hypothetical protein
MMAARDVFGCDMRVSFAKDLNFYGEEVQDLKLAEVGLKLNI